MLIHKMRILLLLETNAPNFDQKIYDLRQVIDGMNNVKTLRVYRVTAERPFDAVKIKSITIEPDSNSTGGGS